MICVCIGNDGAPDNLKHVRDSEGQEGERGKCFFGYMFSAMADSCHHEGRPRGLDCNRGHEALLLSCCTVSSVFLSLAQSTNFAALILTIHECIETVIDNVDTTG